MKQTETAKFLAVIKTAYPNFEITNAVTKLWHECLIDIDFSSAQVRLMEHIRSNRFPPAIAEIVRYDPDQFVDYKRLRSETEERFIEMDAADRQAVPLPERIRSKLLLRDGAGG